MRGETPPELPSGFVTDAAQPGVGRGSQKRAPTEAASMREGGEKKDACHNGAPDNGEFPRLSKRPSIGANYLGGCNPGELAHSSRWAAISAWLTFLSIASLSEPGGRRKALSRASLANEARRSLRGIVCLKRRRRCMIQPRCLRVLTAEFALLPHSNMPTFGRQFPSQDTRTRTGLLTLN